MLHAVARLRAAGIGSESSNISSNSRISACHEFSFEPERADARVGKAHRGSRALQARSSSSVSSQFFRLTSCTAVSHI